MSRAKAGRAGATKRVEVGEKAAARATKKKPVVKKEVFAKKTGVVKKSAARAVPTFEPEAADLALAEPMAVRADSAAAAARAAASAAVSATTPNTEKARASAPNAPLDAKTVVELRHEAEVMRTLDEEPLEAWHKLRLFSSALGPQRIYTSPTAIMFSKSICYMFVRPKKKYLQLNFFLPESLGDKVIQNVHRKSRTKFAHTMKITHEDQIEFPVTEWVKRAYATTD